MFTNIISAIGNNNSIYPLLVRDCGIENVAKVILTYKQNAKDSKVIAKHAVRERIIDEYGSSAVWLGGIPFFGKICDFFIRKSGFSPNIDIKLLKESKEQGLEYNIKKFKDIAPESVKNLIKIKNNKSLYKKLAGAKFLATTLIPISLMGYVLPKLNFGYTKQKREIEIKKIKAVNFSKKLFEDFESYKTQIEEKQKNVVFKGLATLADLSPLNKMKILDGGLTIGRVGTARGKNEKLEMAFKMGGMYYLNFHAPKTIDKALNFITKKLFKINVDLDPKILTDKKLSDNFGTLKLPKNNLLSYIDENPKSIFSYLADKAGIINILKSGVRNPDKYVDISKLEKFKNNLSEYINCMKKSGNPQKMAKRTFRAKSFNILTNILFSSFLLAIVLPKAQFLFRKLVTGSNLEPGIK